MRNRPRAFLPVSHSAAVASGGDGLPAQVTGVAQEHVALVVDREQVQPAVVGQVAQVLVTLEDRGDRDDRRREVDRQAQGLVNEALPIVQRLQRQADAQVTAVPLEDPDTRPDDVVQGLVAAAENAGSDGGTVVLQADPGGYHHRAPS
jgi:hypothetical protein